MTPASVRRIAAAVLCAGVAAVQTLALHIFSFGRGEAA